MVIIKGVVARSPCRIALLNSGSDLPEFFMNYGDCHIISLAITKYVAVSLWNKIPSYSNELSEQINEGIDNPYIAQAMKQSPLLRWKVSIESDITGKGSGLGASSALSVSLISALYPNMSKENIWKRAGILEILELKNPIGYQDQLSATYGGLNHFTIDKNMLVNKINLGIELANELADNILIFKLAGERTSEGHNNLTNLNLEMHKKAPFIQESMSYALPMQEALLKRDFEIVGKMMRELWVLTLLVHGMPREFAKEYMDAGIELGAYAGKISGSMSNGAGHLFFLCPPDTHDNIREKMSEMGLPELYFEADLEGVKTWEIN